MDRRVIATAIDPQAFDGTLARMIPSGVEDAQEAALAAADRVIARLEGDGRRGTYDPLTRRMAQAVLLAAAGSPLDPAQLDEARAVLAAP